LYVTSSSRIPDHTALQIDQFLSDLQEKEKGGVTCRGPFLAQLEFEKLILDRILPDTRKCKPYIHCQKNILKMLDLSETNSNKMSIL